MSLQSTFKFWGKPQHNNSCDIFKTNLWKLSTAKLFFHGSRCLTVSVCCSFFFIEFSLCGQLFHFLITSFCQNRYFYFVNVYFDDLYDGQTWFSDHLYLCYWVVVWSHQQVVKLYQNLLFFFKFVFLYFEIDILKLVFLIFKFIFVYFLICICVVELLFGVTNCYLPSSAARLWNYIKTYISLFSHLYFFIFKLIFVYFVICICVI